MSVSREDFHVAVGMFTSLQPLATDREGRIAAISVTIGGIEGSSPRARNPVSYKVLASVQTHGAL